MGSFKNNENLKILVKIGRDMKNIFNDSIFEKSYDDVFGNY